MAKPYLYTLKEPFVYSHPLLRDIHFQNQWVLIDNGRLVISEKYSWDGCSPKISVFDLFVIGAPDGRMHKGKPITNDASLVHDALTQFAKQMPPSMCRISQVIFDQMLEEVGFKSRLIYVWFVENFGPQPRDFGANYKRA